MCARKQQLKMNESLAFEAGESWYERPNETPVLLYHYRMWLMRRLTQPCVSYYYSPWQLTDPSPHCLPVIGPTPFDPKLARMWNWVTPLRMFLYQFFFFLLAIFVPDKTTLAFQLIKTSFQLFFSSIFYQSKGTEEKTLRLKKLFTIISVMLFFV